MPKKLVLLLVMTSLAIVKTRGNVAAELLGLGFIIVKPRIPRCCKAAGQFNKAP